MRYSELDSKLARAGFVTLISDTFGVTRDAAKKWLETKDPEYGEICKKRQTKEGFSEIVAEIIWIEKEDTDGEGDTKAGPERA